MTFPLERRPDLHRQPQEHAPTKLTMNRILLCCIVALTVCACQRAGVEPTSTDVPFGPGVLVEDPPRAPRDFDLTERGTEALEILMKAERFTTDAIGYAGVMPDEVIALRRLFQESYAAEALAYVERNASMAGRLFALVGLYRADRPRFDTLLESYRKSQATVEFMTGCCVLPGTLVREIVDKGDRAPRLKVGQSLQEWYEAHGSYELDIAGGGWTNLFLEGGGYSTPEDVYASDLSGLDDTRPSED